MRVSREISLGSSLHRASTDALIMIANRPENIPNVQRDTTTTEKDNLYGQLFVYML